MKRNLLAALAAAPTFLLLVSADSIPAGCYHDPKWGNAIVVNDCSNPAYYVYDNEVNFRTIAPTATLSVPLYTKIADGGGGNIKLVSDPKTDLWATPPQPMTQFEFTPTNQQCFFDVSNVNSNIGDGKNGNGEDCEGLPPFYNGGLKLQAPPNFSESCAAKQNPCPYFYAHNNDNSATHAAPLGADITLTLCPQGGSSSGDDDATGSGSSSSSSSPNPPPSSPPAPTSTQQSQTTSQPEMPVVEEKDKEEEVVWVTAVVTTTVPAHKRELPTPQAEKRHEHIHQHVHNKFNKRRHGA